MVIIRLLQHMQQKNKPVLEYNPAAYLLHIYMMAEKCSTNLYNNHKVRSQVPHLCGTSIPNHATTNDSLKYTQHLSYSTLN